LLSPWFAKIGKCPAPIADNPSDINDVAPMNPDKMPIVEPRFDIADGERAKQFVRRA
jgi:hypothetical protein